MIQKRYMKKFIKKPCDMKIRALVSRIQELNNYLPSFPPSVSGTVINAALNTVYILNLDVILNLKYFYFYQLILITDIVLFA